MSSDDNLAHARQLLAAIAAGATGPALAAFYAPDVVQEEFPNRFLPTGARRDLAGLLEAAERGQKVMRSQTWELLNAFASGDQVAMEFRWTGTLAIAIGPLAAGATMSGRYATILEYRGGKIARQRNYDCFDPF